MPRDDKILGDLRSRLAHLDVRGSRCLNPRKDPARGAGHMSSSVALPGLSRPLYLPRRAMADDGLVVGAELGTDAGEGDRHGQGLRARGGGRHGSCA